MWDRSSLDLEGTGHQVTAATGDIIHDWPGYLSAGVLVLIRLSGLIVFAPILSSSAITGQVKAGLAVAMTILLAPVVAVLPGARPVLDFSAVLGELGVGLTLGLALTMLNEALNFAGTVMGFEFSFSLVSLLDPNTMIETPVLGQMLGWLGILVILGAGLHRTMILAVMRSFSVVPVGQAALQVHTGVALSGMASGLFLAGLQLAAPVLAAALTVEVTVALIGRLSPQLPVLVVSIPLKAIASYVVLIASLAVWPGWIERHFNALLDAASKLVVPAQATF
jgi:flagellar biosynthetic protein FliR